MYCNDTKHLTIYNCIDAIQLTRSNTKKGI
nr:MAG TPA: hypothetical protein [Caudoviricetes sp.]